MFHLYMNARVRECQVFLILPSPGGQNAIKCKLRVRVREREKNKGSRTQKSTGLLEKWGRFSKKCTCFCESLRANFRSAWTSSFGLPRISCHRWISERDFVCHLRLQGG